MASQIGVPEFTKENFGRTWMDQFGGYHEEKCCVGDLKGHVGEDSNGYERLCEGHGYRVKNEMEDVN